MEVDPWERQTRESPQAYRGFVTYRDQTPPRSIRAVAEAIPRPIGTVRRWQFRWKWTERALAWDRHVQATIDAQTSEAIKEMSKRHVALARAMSSKVAQRLQRLDPGELTPATMAAWFAALVRVERLALGLSTDRVDRQGAPDIAVDIAVDFEDPQQHPIDYDPIGEVMDRLALAGVLPAPPGIDPPVP